MALTQCELCLENNPSSVSLYTESGEYNMIVSKLFNSVLEKSFEITNVCTQCYRTLKDCCAFYRRVRDAHLTAKENFFENRNIEYHEVDIEYEHKQKNEFGSLEINSLEDFDKPKLKEEIVDIENFLPSDDLNTEDAPSCDEETFEGNEVDSKDESVLKTLLTSDNADIQDQVEDIKSRKRKKKTLKKLISDDVSSKKKLKKVIQKEIKIEIDEIPNDGIPIQFSLKFDGFPEKLVDAGVLTLTGNPLTKLLNRFYSLQCHLCVGGNHINSIDRLFEHYKSEHVAKGYVECCDTKFFNRRGMSWHMARHYQPLDFQCPTCKINVWKPSILEAHMRSHVPESKRTSRYKCDQCGKNYISPSGLWCHKLKHVPVENRKKFTCKFCPKTFDLRPLYSIHLSTVHSKVINICFVCGKAISGKHKYEMHMKKHDPKTNEKIQCKDCGFFYSNEETLKAHVLRIHSPHPYSCTLCTFTTHRAWQLKRHMTVRHTDLRPFSCPICEKRFKLQTVLNRHLERHQGDKTYVCEFCSKRFASSGNYYTHRKRMHPSEVKQLKSKRNKS